ncbi:MFS transporter [Alteromonas sp. BMJM2]|uniref:MFS transporter n=1 Tax=Alteromonas sp. BMJM2 TaxID=2954241 RepID=UPI0022B3DFDA|nr:MFS transporter [Alteromonas sp. BMJM2]
MTNTDISGSQASRLFLLSCIALTVTAMTFGIRAGILGQLGVEFDLSNEQLGYVNLMAFWGFPLATMFGGVLYNAIGARALIWIAFACHLLGLVLTIYAQSFWGLMLSSLFIGFANGSVEAGCNPVIADLFKNNKTTMLNKFHVWFPGGIVIGALISWFMTNAGIGWQWQIAVMLLPTLLYGALLMGAVFPQPDKAILSTSSNFKHLLTPVYFFLVFCMTITATTELGTTQWIQKIMGENDVHPMIIMALIFGIMSVGRYFAGPLVHRFNPSGVLLCSAIISTVGLFLLSQLSGSMIYVATIIFALGVTYFWPTMIGCVAEYLPKTGALGMSLIGGAGMFAVGIWNPVIGGWVDAAEAKAIAQGATPEIVATVAGPAVLQNLMIFPLVLIVAYAGFFFYMKNRNNAIEPVTN